MVNIQIRGNLVHLGLKTFPASENFDSIINSNSQTDFKNYIKNTLSEQNVIYQNTLPIIDSNCEIHVTSFENDNYYDDGYTFFRSNLDELKCENENLKIPLELFGNDYFLLNIKYGYGTGFETEIMDLNYENFETKNLEIFKTKISGIQHSIVQSLKLNYLNLEDLGRDKFDFSNTQSFLLKNTYDKKYFIPDETLNEQVEVITTTEW
mgnify:CR=1 FL=1